MQFVSRWGVVVAIGLLVFGWGIGLGPLGEEDQPVGAAEPAGPSLEPVVESMHQFMEYVFEPNYKLLRQHLAAEPADKKGWKPIKAASLMLAESGNLLLLRTPEEEGARWNELSVAVRQLSGQLYHTARDRDYPSASKQYRALLQKCNACHQEFAEGKYQLQP
ncbi:MAG: hypothetical protein GTO53_06360 [Planctomycetales bacterium]|nr:hypothetical protein [Planctomycetales bacterium]NIM08764.1 hypothetical protein [Planctomycetales bacterium]NIN08227.1 hypothetical protein [Planctomycetales bacterium]NIN77355.1 hypothetical protein [Planctomycetales bacterium]NIO34538.1 hypothetical protein [Planctomycetales bacterium]